MGLGQERAKGNKDGEIKKQLDGTTRAQEIVTAFSHYFRNCREENLIAHAHWLRPIFIA
jgi:hypothetical protein